MIQLTVTDTLQNFTNDYVFETQDDMVAALNLLLDFAYYTQEHLKSGSLQLRATSDKPLDTSKPYYHFRKERKFLT